MMAGVKEVNCSNAVLHVTVCSISYKFGFLFGFRVSMHFSVPHLGIYNGMTGFVMQFCSSYLLRAVNLQV